MTKTLAGLLLAIALISGLVPPGAAAYIGAYIALGASALGLTLFGWPERSAFVHPVAIAIQGAMALICATLPFVYHSAADLAAPVFILPMLATIALGMLGSQARWVPSPFHFALFCMAAAILALAGGLHEQFVLSVERVGMGNNPIHYASLAAMTGGLALVGCVTTASRWRFLFLLGPVFGLGATILSGSRGPLAGALAMAGIGLVFLLIWFWRDRLFRFAVLAAGMLAVGVVAYLVVSGDDRASALLDTALDIFRFTGGTDDIRASLYASARHDLAQSPIFGIGFGQLMQTARALYPDPSILGLDNLHADWANFATMAGSIGLLAWLLLLGAPLLLLRDPIARTDRPIILGAVLLVTGQAVLGVSNATFGILPQTVLYAVALGYLLGRARRMAVTKNPAEPAKQI